MSMADSLKVPRPVMVEERRKIGLDYGSFFVAHELLASGVAMTDLLSGQAWPKKCFDRKQPHPFHLLLACWRKILFEIMEPIVEAHVDDLLFDIAEL
jgi:hypothetical protein